MNENALGARGRHDAGAAPVGSGRARWRIAEWIISFGIGGGALTVAVFLGVTGPPVSPVSTAAGTVQAGSQAVTDAAGAGTAPAARTPGPFDGDHAPEGGFRDDRHGGFGRGGGR